METITMDLIIIGILTVVGIGVFMLTYERRLRHREGPWIFDRSYQERL